MNKTIYNIGVILVLLLYIYAGINKIIDFNKEYKSLKNQLNISSNFAKFLIGCTIFIEIFVVIALGISLIFQCNKYISYTLLGILMLWLLIITFIMHPIKDHTSAFLKNISLFGGLLIIVSII